MARVPDKLRPPLHPNTQDYYHWHFEVMPKVTKVAGFEWASGFYINPTSPEEAAHSLCEASQIESTNDAKPVPTARS